MTNQSLEKRVLAVVRQLNGGDEASAQSWDETEKQREFDGATAQEMMRRGRSEAVQHLLEMYDAGTAGQAQWRGVLGPRGCAGRPRPEDPRRLTATDSNPESTAEVVR